jgi:hypothetical protein
MRVTHKDEVRRENHPAWRISTSAKGQADIAALLRV